MTTEKKEEISSALKNLEPYAEYTYDWAFNRWEDIVWQEFESNGQKVGSNVFIVRAAQTPGRGEENNWREKKSIWNQAWFSSLRSAYGYQLWGKYWKDANMVHRAELAKNFALSAPQKNGIFPSVYTADKEHKWENGTWGHSDRRPEGHEDYGHLLDMSWTCFWMLKWYEDIEKDTELLEYATRYADSLLTTQSVNGSFPGWINEQTGETSPYLKESAETSMHVWFLAHLYDITKEKSYLRSAENGIDFVMKEIIPYGRWEDFETYWSCSRMWEGKKYGEKDQRSGLYNQSNFSIYWTTEALMELYQITNKTFYLDLGEKVLAELSLHQAIWNAPYLKIPVLGGFGVLTSDDEWNDARQSLFAKTYYKYYKITGRQEYKYRCIWAMKASFYMMYCPENPEVKKMYEDTFPYFWEKDYGFEMENFHHGANGDDSHLKVGEFTIFDWGNGSASSTLAELLVK